MSDDLILRSVTARSFDRESRTFEAVIATPAPYARRDARGPYAEVLDTTAIDPAALTGLPLLDNHRNGSVRDTIGTVLDARREGEALVARLQLSGADDVKPVIQRIEDGTLRGVSIGYRVTSWREQTGTTRTKVAAAWAIHEVTLTTTPAGTAGEVSFLVRPEQVRLVEDTSVSGVVRDVVFHGPFAVVRVAVADGTTVTVRVAPTAVPDRGTTVGLHLDGVAGMFR